VDPETPEPGLTAFERRIERRRLRAVRRKRRLLAAQRGKERKYRGKGKSEGKANMKSGGKKKR